MSDKVIIVVKGGVVTDIISQEEQPCVFFILDHDTKALMEFEQTVDKSMVKTLEKTADFWHKP